ncbi:unnamed protein product, partial [Vitis vinifera]
MVFFLNAFTRKNTSTKKILNRNTLKRILIKLNYKSSFGSISFSYLFFLFHGLILVSLLRLLFFDITCFSQHLIAVSPSQTLRQRPNHAFFFLSPEIADLLTAEVWRSIICLIWFWVRSRYFVIFCLRVFEI